MNKFIPPITTYLKIFSDTLKEARETIEKSQDQWKTQADKDLRPTVPLAYGVNVLLRTHILSNVEKRISSKLAPKRDGP